MNRFTTALLMLLVALTAGCSQDTPAPVAEPAASVETPADQTTPATPPPAEDIKTVAPAEIPAVVPGTDAAIIEDHSNTSKEVSGFDTKNFAGLYVEGDTALNVTDDGMFALNIDGNAIDGTWSVKPDGKTVVLDPDSKGEADHKLRILSQDSVQIDGGATLQRHHGGR